MSPTDKHLYEFGPFRLDPAEERLLHDDRPVPLEPKVFETLLVLVRKPGRLLTKEELMKEVWPDSFVEEGNLARNISVLRKTLGDPAFIETVPKRGYRFAAAVHVHEDEGADLIVRTSERMSIVVDEEIVDDGADQPAVALAQDALAGRTSTSPRFLRRHVRTLTAVATGLALIVTSLWLAKRWSEPADTASTSGAITSLAVLPFKSLSAQPDEEYLGVGLADVVITRLSGLGDLAVRPTNSVLPFGAEDPLQAGQALRVDSVLDGTVQQQGDRVRVTVRLVRVRDGQALWSYQCDAQGTDVFALQDTISVKVTEALALRLTDDEQRRLARRYTGNPEAFEAYLKGRYFWSKWNKVSLEKAVEYFERAIELDPNYAAAWAGLADSYHLLAYLGYGPPRELYPKANESIRRALELDDALSEAHLSLAKLRLFYEWDFAGTEREIRRALALNPNAADAHGFNGAYLTAMGRFDEALVERQRALDLDPLSPFVVTEVGWVYFYQRRYDEAIIWYRKAIELDPNFGLTHLDLGNAYYLKGQIDEAMNEYLTARKLSGASEEGIATLRKAYVAGGVEGYWRLRLAQSEEAEKQGRIDPWFRARIHAELGQKDQAFSWLEKAYEERSSLIPFLDVTPIFESLHPDPRFGGLLRRVGFAEHRTSGPR